MICMYIYIYVCVCVYIHTHTKDLHCTTLPAAPSPADACSKLREIIQWKEQGLLNDDEFHGCGQPDRKLNHRFCLPPFPPNCNVGEKVSVHDQETRYWQQLQLCIGGKGGQETINHEHFELHACVKFFGPTKKIGACLNFAFGGKGGRLTKSGG